MAFGDVEGKQLEEVLEHRAKGETQQFPFTMLACRSSYLIFLNLTACDEVVDVAFLSKKMSFIMLSSM